MRGELAVYAPLYVVEFVHAFLWKMCIYPCYLYEFHNFYAFHIV